MFFSEQKQHPPAILCTPYALTIQKVWLHYIAARTTKEKKKAIISKNLELFGTGMHDPKHLVTVLQPQHHQHTLPRPRMAKEGTEQPNLHAQRTRMEGETSAPATSRTEILLQQVNRREGVSTDKPGRIPSCSSSQPDLPIRIIPPLLSNNQLG